MRIAHVISAPGGLGGAERVMSWIVGGGEERGVAQVVLNPFASGRDRGELAAVCRAPVVARTTERVPQLPATRRWLARELDRFEPDVVQVFLPYAGALVASLRRRPGRRLVFSHQHGDHFVVNGMRAWAVIDRLAGRRYDRVVACSAFVERFLVERYRYPPESVARITNGWEGTPRPGTGLADRPTVICVANFRAQKGHDVLLRAFARVHERVGTAQLVLVGGGAGRGEVEATVARLGLQAHVSVPGAVDDVWPHLEQAHVFALASRYEPLGVVVLEAMAAGLPVAATRVGGIPEIMPEGVAGTLVEPDDDIALAEALVTLLESPDLRAQMSAAGRAVAAEHRAERMVGRYLALYDELLSRRDS
jgi:glycosyltransferase involved in cell wall biosynthesis